MRQAREDGQATIELVALLPCLAAVVALLWQLALAGHAVWAAAAAARAAARAHAVGAEAGHAARGHLPAALRRGLKVRTGDGGEVEVSVRIPRLLVDLGRVTASARFEPQDGAPR